MIEVSKQKNKIIVSCSLVLIFLVLRCWNDIFVFPTVAISLISILLLDKYNSFIYLLFLLPFANIFKFSPESISIVSLLFFAYILKLSLYSKMSQKLVFSILAFVMYSIAVSGLEQIIAIGTIACGFFMIYDVSSDEQYSYKNAIYSFSAGFIASSTLALFKDYLPILKKFINAVVLKMGQDAYVTRFSGIQANPNYYTLDTSIILSCLVVMLFYEKKIKINIILFTIVSAFALLSLSKSFLLTWGLILLALFAASVKRGGTKAVKIAIIFIGLGFFVHYFASNIVNVYIARLTGGGNQSLSDFTTGRSDIFVYYSRLILNDLKILIFGNGIRDVLAAGTHNTFIETIYSLGIVGTTLLLICLKYSINKSKIKNRNKNILIFLPVLILLIRLMAISTLTFDNMPYYISLICLMFLYFTKEKNKNESL